MNTSGASKSTEITEPDGDSTPALEGNGEDIENQNPEAPPSVIIELANTVQGNGSQTSEGKGTGICGDPIEFMYRAALKGDWAVAEKLLQKDPTLAYKERKGYRPLHVAVALKHDKFALKLIEKMKPEDLELEDSNDITACSYAAAAGELDIAREMIKKNKNLVKDSFVHIFSAILSRNSELVSYLLDQIEVGVLDEYDWLQLSQKAIGTKMYDVALKILEKNGSHATKRSIKEGTPLHVLARQDISAASTGKPAIIFKSIFGTTVKGRQGQGKMPPDFRLLAKKLFAKIQEMKEPRVLELLGNPPILHDAARVGNMELINMLTDAYPDLIWQTDDKQRSLFNIAIEYREANVFSFLQQFGPLNFTCLFHMDEDKNNLLHLAANLGKRKNVIPALQMQSELAWFKAVELMLPLHAEDKNKDKKKPRDLFVEKHEKLLEESKAWMKSTADSCMLIATIILTIAYAAAFTVPGGNNGATGLPVLVNSNWLTCFFIFEALALFSSTLCIITFWSITCSGFEEDQFLDILPYQLRLGFTALFASLIGAISAFLSAYNMVLVEGKAWLVKSFLLLIYVILVLAIYGRFSELWYKTKLPECLPQMMSKGNSQGGLYSQHGRTDHNENKSDHSEDSDDDNCIMIEPSDEL
ncbi:hypothetical protein C2S52_001902 [Perilla frutescens var. hirtella]|nr:hypothetical protein C2S52_001902 [Perilla frutescens var. hirtella]